MKQPRRKHDELFRRFVDRCAFFGLTMPVDGKEVADHLLELLAGGASLSEIDATAKAIIAGYERHRFFLDRRPIRRALAVVAAQLAPNRVLN
jgi:hypothetical protein